MAMLTEIDRRTVRRMGVVLAALTGLVCLLTVVAAVVG